MPWLYTVCLSPHLYPVSLLLIIARVTSPMLVCIILILIFRKNQCYSCHVKNIGSAVVKLLARLLFLDIKRLTKYTFLVWSYSSCLGALCTSLWILSSWLKWFSCGSNLFWLMSLKFFPVFFFTIVLHYFTPVWFMMGFLYLENFPPVLNFDELKNWHNGPLCLTDLSLYSIFTDFSLCLGSIQLHVFDYLQMSVVVVVVFFF